MIFKFKIILIWQINFMMFIFWLIILWVRAAGDDIGVVRPDGIDTVHLVGFRVDDVRE